MEPFFPKPPGLTIGEIASLTGAAPRGPAGLERVIRGIGSLEWAQPSDLVFVEDAADLKRLAGTRAGACLIGAASAAHVPASTVALCTSNPFRDFVTVAGKLYPDSLRPRSLYDGEPMAAGALVHPSAELEDGVIVDPGAVIGPRAGIGSGTVIGANVVIGPDVQIGRDGSVGPGASIVHALIGDRVTIHAGCRIGQEGSAVRHDAERPVKVPQLGRVIIQDHVEIGATTTVDRGGCGDTVIGEGSKIDNLVRIGHNVTIGRHCIVVAQGGLPGGAVLGDHVTFGDRVTPGGSVAAERP
jgi:UDP-3-O-[3-hydroxymyristoyl] glucosamine N-acyltransferase